MPQIPLSFSSEAEFLQEDFLVSDANKDAYDLITSWPNWDMHALLLSGPVSSGKTHLAHLWQTQSKASFIDIAQIDAMASSILTSKGQCWIVEDIETIPSEDALLHIFNAVKESGGFLLMSSIYTSSQLPFTLPDLTSRLSATAHVALHTPDDMLVHMLLSKYFSDKQLRVSTESIEYLASRIERSYGAIKEIVNYIDQESMRDKRNITIPFMKSVLERYAAVDTVDV